MVEGFEKEIQEEIQGHKITEEMHMFQDPVKHGSKVIGQSQLEDWM